MVAWTRGKCIGKGGFGQVFMAIPTDPTQPLMAVKSMPCEDGDNVDPLITELLILQKFRDCPRIIQCFGACIHQTHIGGPTTYDLLLEYAAGGSLSDLIDRYDGDGMPEKEVRVCTRMILEGLVSIHSHGYTHCNIKPDNILVFPDPEDAAGAPQLKIADLGLAMADSDLGPESRNYGGTTRYMPPEVVFDGKVSPAMDIWALGCTVIQMVTGKRPWANLKNKEEVVDAIGKGRRPEMPGWLSTDGKDFLEKCFQREQPSDQCESETTTSETLLDHPFVKPRVVQPQKKQRRSSASADDHLRLHQTFQRSLAVLQC